MDAKTKLAYRNQTSQNYFYENYIRLWITRVYNTFSKYAHVYWKCRTLCEHIISIYWIQAAYLPVSFREGCFTGIEPIVCLSQCLLIWYDLVTAYGDIDLILYWLRKWFAVWRPKPLLEPMLTNHQWCLVVGISQKMMKFSVFNMSFEIINFWHPRLPGANELSYHKRSRFIENQTEHGGGSRSRRASCNFWIYMLDLFNFRIRVFLSLVHISYVFCIHIYYFMHCDHICDISAKTMIKAKIYNEVRII